MTDYFEIEWLDRNGEGHAVTFSAPGGVLSQATREFLQAIEPVSAMTAVYHIHKERHDPAPKVDPHGPYCNKFTSPFGKPDLRIFCTEYMGHTGPCHYGRKMGRTPK